MLFNGNVRLIIVGLNNARERNRGLDIIIPQQLCILRYIIFHYFLSSYGLSMIKSIRVDMATINLKQLNMKILQNLYTTSRVCVLEHLDMIKLIAEHICYITDHGFDFNQRSPSEQNGQPQRLIPPNIEGDIIRVSHH